MTGAHQLWHQPASHEAGAAGHQQAHGQRPPRRGRRRAAIIAASAAISQPARGPDAFSPARPQLQPEALSVLVPNEPDAPALPPPAAPA